MHDQQRIALRMSVRLRAQFISLQTAAETPSLPESVWQECGHVARRIEIAESRGWRLAAGRLRLQWQGTLSRLQAALTETTRQNEVALQPPRRPELRQIYDDLVALENEFVEVRCCPRTATLAVVTDPIVLEGVPLGAFEITLDLQGLGRPQPYDVFAVDARPAASSEQTPHPHVQGHSLCEGDGRMAVRSALAAGRLWDFFVLVSRILQTYNVGSAYVSLEEWDGVSCTDCDALVAGDESTSCACCGSFLCCDCSVLCRDCDEFYCLACLEACPGCEEQFCRGCRPECAGCREKFCNDCLTNERCQDCHENDQPLAAEEPESPAPASHPAVAPASATEASPSGTPLQPHGVGQALVSAGSG